MNNTHMYCIVYSSNVCLVDRKKGLLDERRAVVYFYPILGARKGARYPKSGKNIQQIVTFFNFFMKKGYNFLKKGICRVKVTPRRPFEG